MSSARKQAPRLARPAARYWQGKAPKGVVDVESDSEAEDIPSQEEEGDVPIDGEQDVVEEEGVQIRTETVNAAKAMNISLKDVNISKDGKVTVAGRQESGRTAMEEDELEEEEESDDEQKTRGVDAAESSEYESDSEEEDEKPTLQFRPVFVPKRARVTILEKEAIAQQSEEGAKKKELEAEERRKQSHDLVALSIKRELAEKEKEEAIPDVDDTDGLDPAAEFEAWRLRELGRIKRDKEEELRRDQEREEVERRRAMPEEQRLKEDLERAQKLREEKPKGQQKFLQKYWHKGAFHQDEQILKKHDFTEATESTVDVSLLPKVMQVKNFGKRSRTKYTHLLDQDTTVSASGLGTTKSAGKAGEGAGCFLCGGPHLKKDCPQNAGALSDRRSTVSGANAAPTGPRHWGTSRGTGSWRDQEGEVGDGRSEELDHKKYEEGRPRRREEDRDRDRDRDSHGEGRNGSAAHHYQHRRSHSPAPPPRRSNWRNDERRRSRELSVERDHKDKRRRLD